MHKRTRYKAFIEHFTQQPAAKTELQYDTPFQLLIAVILSAQCTDKRINMVTPSLFKAFPTPAHLANSTFEEVLPYIKSVSYPNNKTRHLLKMAKTLVEVFGGQVPEQVKDLQKLAGVGRKSAHVVASVLYNMPTMAVDTHVMRVSKRLGLVDPKAKTPLAIEKQLVQYIPEQYIGKAHHWLILHGRYTCLARKPQCEICQLTSFCRYFEENRPS
ncbi:MAG: endonuclease III [Bacteroidota bacterium]